ncbi:MAG TPA: rRNA maturation RNase YbeY [Xanthobacteraceae bacterium]|jgi:probable rRNA maturation factor|nr:rRNA maturation RNase YbeY [Xanthobacteraceae bacterium]
MSRAVRPAIDIDIIVASARWKNPKKAQAVLRRAVTRAAAATLSTSPAELAIVLSDDSAIRLLNRDWRGVDAATNVLSFPATKSKRPGSGHLGDVILALETITREARSEGKPFDHHLAHLGVHGFLHLIGYDHEHDSDAEEMEQAERDILHALAIPDPYRDDPVERPKPRKTAKLKNPRGKRPARRAAKRKA